MTDIDSWKAATSQTRAEFRASGGCVWSVQPNSPGMSLRIPAKTPFKIRLEGPESHKFVEGICMNGKFIIPSGLGAGSYTSANETVSAARPQIESKSNNAYLYVEFKVGQSWILADELRYRSDIGWVPDRSEEEAMKLARNAVRGSAKKKKKKLSAEEIEEKAEEVLDKYPEFMERGRNIAEIYSSPII
jgi:hypothetical protein